MNRRFVCVLLALAVSPTVVACGGDDEPKAQAPTLVLSGTYRPVDQGPIGSITFTGSKDYLLMASGCPGGSCAEIGTYRLDAASRVLVLENGVTHQTRSIALEIVKTSSPIAVAQSLRPRDLLEPGQQLTRPGGEQLTDGNGQQLNDPNNEQLATSGNGLTGAILQLLQIVQQFIMNAQQLTRDDQKGIPKDPPKGDVTPKPNPLDCRQGVPTATTPPAEALAYFARCPDGP